MSANANPAGDPVNGPMPGRVLCKDCDHISGGTCVRLIGLHFDAGSNGYRKRLHAGAALERSRTRTLTKRECCGPDARFFEPKGSRAPIVAPVEDVEMTDVQIKQMVDRFLAWKLPTDFAPDCGISFERVSCQGTPHEFHRAPVGTNLFTAAQAEQMIRHMLGQPAAAPVARVPDTIADSDGDDGA